MVLQRRRQRQAVWWARLIVAALSSAACSACGVGSAAAAGDETRLPSIPRSVDGALEGLDVKAKPSEPAPEFVTRTRPSPARLHFLPTAVPHAVSSVPVKTSAQIQAAKDALDAAQVRQLNPVRPVDLLKRSTGPKPAHAETKTEKAKSGADAD